MGNCQKSHLSSPAHTKLEKPKKKTIIKNKTNENPDVSLVEFLEMKYQKKCNNENFTKDGAFYSQWSKGFDYENWFICSLIGQGAFAKVYLVRRTIGLSNRFYAMKAIKKSTIKDPVFVQSTMKEREVLLAMDHQFILKLHYAFQTPFSLYMIFEYVNGGDLFFHIKKNGHLSEKEAKFYGA